MPLELRKWLLLVWQWDINCKPLCLHINSKQVFTSVALLFSSSSLDTIPETAFIFLFFLKDTLKLIIDLAIWLDVHSVLRSLVPTWSIIWDKVLKSAQNFHKFYFVHSWILSPICSGFMSRIVCLTWSCIQLTFAVVNSHTLTIPRV